MKDAAKQGYKTYLYFLFTDNWLLDIERVKLRVRSGGHDVDDKKIKDRYFRSLKLFKDVALLADTAFLIDNSKNFRLMTQLVGGKPEFVSPEYPDWLRGYYDPR